MLVETFEVTELDDQGQLECEEGAVALIEELGLDGQKALLSKNTSQPKRSPYRKMTKEEVTIYKALFPEQTELKKFANEAIPIRVLQVAAHAKAIYDHLHVWHCKSGDVKDPLLVGRNGSEYGDKEYYILARWGDTLASFADLTKLGVQRIKDNARDTLNEIIEKTKSKLALLEIVSDGTIARDGFYIPSVYFG